MAAATMYVTPAGAGNKDGSSWANAMGFSEWMTDFTGAVEPGDLYYVAGGTYTLVADRVAFAPGTAIAPIKIIGVDAETTNEPPVLSDWVFGDDRPLLACSTYAFTCKDYSVVCNLRVTTAAGSGLYLSNYSAAFNCKSFNSSATANYSALRFGAGGKVVSCEAVCTNGYAINVGGSSTILSCFAHASKVGCNPDGSYSPGVHVISSVIKACQTGLLCGPNSGTALIGSTIYGCTTVGIGGTTGYAGAFINNIIAACAIGAAWTTETPDNFWDYNCWHNTTDVSKVTKGPHDITADPLLTDPAAGDFTLAAGSPCFATGMSLGADVGLP